MLTRERMRELIEEHGLSDRADEIIADARPSIHLTLRYDVDEADIPVGASKMGGSPDVPADFERWSDPLKLTNEAALAKIPKTYINCVGDAPDSDSAPEWAQGLDYRELHASHLAMISAPEALTKLLLELA